jgi:serine protease
MYQHSRLTVVLGCITVLAIAGCATHSGVTPTAPSATQPQGRGVAFGPGWVQQDGILYRVPHYMATRGQAHRATTGGLQYGGGPVQVKPKVFLVFWGYTKYGDPDNVRPLLENYIENMGGSSHNDIYTQYYEIVNGKTIYIKNPSSQYGGAWEDNAPLPKQPTQSEVAAEALKSVSHFGYNANASYVVATAHGRNTPGFGTQWCAYQGATSRHGKLVSYTNLPYIPDAGESCGANFITPPSDETGADEGVTIVEGHMQGDSATDPDPPTGWTFEGGDGLCAWTDIENDTFGSYSYTMQPMFSNASLSCVQSS